MYQSIPQSYVPIVCELVTNKDRNVPVYTAILYLFDIVVINLGNMTTKSITSIVRYVIQVDLSDSQILKEYFQFFLKTTFNAQ